PSAATVDYEVIVGTVVIRIAVLSPYRSRKVIRYRSAECFDTQSRLGVARQLQSRVTRVRLEVIPSGARYGSGKVDVAAHGRDMHPIAPHTGQDDTSAHGLGGYRPSDPRKRDAPADILDMRVTGDVGNRYAARYTFDVHGCAEVPQIDRAADVV